MDFQISQEQTIIQDIALLGEAGKRRDLAVRKKT